MTQAADFVQLGYHCLFDAAVESLAINRLARSNEAKLAKLLCCIPKRAAGATQPSSAKAFFDSVLNSDTRLKLVDTLQSQLDLMAESAEGPALLKNQEPAALLVGAYAFLERRARIKNNPLVRVDTHALMLIGLGARGMCEMTLCQFCPRLAIPGHVFCREHSQSVQVSGTPSEKASRYTAGKKVAEMYNWFHQDIPNFFQLTPKSLPSFLARLLWQASLPDEARTMAANKLQIRKNRELQAIIGGDFEDLSGLKFYARLQETIDPYEVRPRVWRWKLQRLRLWLSYQYALAHAAKMPASRTWSQIRQASELEREGLNQSDIAKRLGVTRSALSNWRKRYGGRTFCEIVDNVISARSMVRGVRHYEKCLADELP